MVAKEKIFGMILLLFISSLNGMDNQLGFALDERRSLRLIGDSVRVPLLSEPPMCLEALDFRWLHKAARHGVLTRSLIKKDFDKLKNHIKNGASVNEYDERGVSLAWQTIDMRKHIGENMMVELYCARS